MASTRKITAFICVLMAMVSCNLSNNSSNKLIVFHAGSMSVPLHDLSVEFMNNNPDTEIALESAGSVACARKVTDLERECDILVSADYKVIDELLIPDFASYNIWFTVNEIVLVYNDKSKYAKDINNDNWYEILLRDDVFYGRSDPNSDPCGYRSVITIELAEDYYEVSELSKKLLAKDLEYIRPKASDLLALLEINAVDYVFEYKTVAEQHKLNYIGLPDSINLKNPDLQNWYKTKSINIAGKKPGEYITLIGEPIVYGLTIINNSKNKELAGKFVEFMVESDKGKEIFQKNSHQILSPVICLPFDSIPDFLKD